MSTAGVRDPLKEKYTFPGWPRFEEDEVQAVRRVLESGKVNYWTGQEGRQFEREFAEYFGAKHAIALANGSLAIESTLQALNLQPGDEVVVTPRTFLASASSAIIRGLTPVFADVDRDSGNLTAETIEAVVTPKTKAAIVVHLGGWPCEMQPIVELGKARGFAVIEDCAQSHGAKIDGHYAGTFGIVNAWSFCQDKVLTTGGEGGMVTTDDPGLWNRAWSYKDHGKSYEAVYHTPHPPGFRWLHESFGSNWRLTESQSAIGRIQLTKLHKWVSRRRRAAQILASRLGDVSGVRVPMPRPGIDAAFYRFYAYLDLSALKSGYTREQLISEISETGVPFFSGTCSEIYLEKAFDGTGFRPAKKMPVAKELGETSVAFLTHPTLEDSDVETAAEVFAAAFERAKR